MTHLEHCTRNCKRLARTSLFMRGRSNDTLGTLHEGLQAIGKNKLVYARPAMTQVEDCMKGFLAIAKNRFDYARP